MIDFWRSVKDALQDKLPKKAGPMLDNKRQLATFSMI
jgi:hypothetical protein